MSDTLFTKVPFSDLDLAPELQQGIQDAGFQYCTRIQAESLPLALAGRDVAGQAQTGTGKTAAFLLAAMSHVLRHPPLSRYRPGNPRVLMLAPTRELAIQIARDGEVLGRHTGLRLVVVYGGAGYDTQREQLKAGVDILMGTPGRLIDYYRQHIFRLDGVQVVVLDEADRMFDLGFIKDIRYLLRRLPPPDQRLNMLFSATLSWRVSELAYEHMNDPMAINVAPDKRTADRVDQLLYHVSSDEKVSLLLGLLQRMDPRRTLIFVNMKREAERLRNYLVGNDLEAEVLSGDVPQKKRLRLLTRFEEGELPILVATDVAARGLHIPDVSHVFNYDLPQDAEDYVHRIGRTARVGASGNAVSLACEHFVYSLAEIEEFIGHRIPSAPVTDDLLVKTKPPVRSPPRARRGARAGAAGRKGSPGRRLPGGRRKRRTQGSGTHQAGPAAKPPVS
jgi:ATP-dependent RNA helicase RhlB